MIQDTTQAQQNLAQQKDRITQLLTRQAGNQSFGQDVGDISQSLLSALSQNTGAAGFQQAQGNINQQRQSAQGSLYKIMQDEVAQGNEEAAHVDKAIKDITGSDIQGYEKIADVIHKMPEKVGVANANMMAIRAANSLGYKSKMNKDEADIRLKNAQANYYNQRGNYSNRPIPATALKMQNEGLETIGTMNAINSDLKGIVKQMDDGSLDLGPLDNLVSRGRNKLGMSSQNSTNFASFKSTLEKQRNDSLRLNKGVQTEGDAQRAWNELFENLNDPKVVRQRLEEIQVINERGADLQKLNVDQIRANYGAEPLDYSAYERRPGATNLEPSEEDINHTAQKYGITPDEVRRRLKK